MRTASLRRMRMLNGVHPAYELSRQLEHRGQEESALAEGEEVAQLPIYR